MLNKKLLSFCKALLQLPLREADFGFGYVDHPFFSSAIIPDENGNFFNILESEENENRAKEIMDNILNKCEDIHELTMIVNRKYYLTFYDHGHIYMKPQERGEFIQNIYNSIESLETMDSQFKSKFLKYLLEIDKKYLMNEDDMAFYNSLPDNIDIYRGVNGKSTKSGKVTKDLWKSISWTTDREKAIWFANRFVSKDSPVERVLYSTTIPKEYVVFACKYESQICLNYKKIHEKDIEKTILLKDETMGINENKMTAEKCNFQGEIGYMIRQYYKGELVADQFVTEDGLNIFREHCAEMGLEVEMI